MATLKGDIFYARSILEEAIALDGGRHTGDPSLRHSFRQMERIISDLERLEKLVRKDEDSGRMVERSYHNKYSPGG